MKAVIFSDTHGNEDFVNFMVSYLRPDIVFHLGDGIEDVSGIIGKVTVHTVCGNCDWSPESEYWKIVEVAEKRIFITHGDRFGVDEGLEPLVSFASGKGSDIVLYGHTHKPCVCRVDGLIIVNPGSAMLGERMFSCAVMEFQSDNVHIFHVKKYNAFLKSA